MRFPLPIAGAAWFAMWILDRLLREVEDGAVHVVDTEYSCICLWCPSQHVVKRAPHEGPPTEPPRGWLESRRYPGYYWCSTRCWAQHFDHDPSHGYPAGEGWDEALADTDEL